MWGPPSTGFDPAKSRQMRHMPVVAILGICQDLVEIWLRFAENLSRFAESAKCADICQNLPRLAKICRDKPKLSKTCRDFPRIGWDSVDLTWLFASWFSRNQVMLHVATLYPPLLRGLPFITGGGGLEDFSVLCCVVLCCVAVTARRMSNTK